MSHELPSTVSRPTTRWWLVASALVAAGAHLPVIGPHLHEAPYMGLLFILLTAACLGIAAVVAVGDRTWAYAAALPVCSAAVLGYAATRLVAFPQLADDVGNWFEPLGVLSVLSESAVVLLAASRLLRQH